MKRKEQNIQTQKSKIHTSCSQTHWVEANENSK